MTRDEVVQAARRWVGTPYHHQASNLQMGCDCLGLVRGVWRELIGPEPQTIPAYSADWAEVSADEGLLEALARHFVPADPTRPGSVLVFRWKAGTAAKHVGVSVGGRRFVHAYDGAGRVVEGALGTAWRRRLAAAFDFPGVTD